MFCRVRVCVRVHQQYLQMQALPVFTFANQGGLDMLETTLVALQDITLERIFNDNGKKTLFAELPQIMQQVTKSSLLPRYEKIL